MLASQRFEWPRPIWGCMTLSASCALLLHSILYASQWKAHLSGSLVLYGSPVHLISSSFTFLASASSHWMKVTRTIFVPGMDVTHMVLPEHPNTLCIIIWINALLLTTKMFYRGTFDHWIWYAATTSPVLFAFALHSFSFGNFVLYLVFISSENCLLSSLFQVIALSSTHVFSTFINLAGRVMQWWTWLFLNPHPATQPQP